MTTDQIRICRDCAYMSANGADTEFPDGFIESYVARATELNAEPVLVADENGDYGDHFSWSSCDFCVSRLGGDRYPAVILYK